MIASNRRNYILGRCVRDGIRRREIKVHDDAGVARSTDATGHRKAGG